MAAFRESGVGGTGSFPQLPSAVEADNSAKLIDVVSWATIDATLNFRARRYGNKNIVVASRAGSRLEEYQPLVFQSILLDQPVCVISPATRTFVYVFSPPMVKWGIFLLVVFAVAFAARMLYNQVMTIDQLIELTNSFKDLVHEVAAARAGTP
jgi:hypothetical protein